MVRLNSHFWRHQIMILQGCKNVIFITRIKLTCIKIIAIKLCWMVPLSFEVLPTSKSSLTAHRLFQVRLEMLQKEFLLEPIEVVAQTVDKVLGMTQPSVWIRHYNFVDFQRFGSPGGWRPDWFNVVRDPIERVRYLLWTQIFHNRATLNTNWTTLVLVASFGYLIIMTCHDFIL